MKTNTPVGIVKFVHALGATGYLLPLAVAIAAALVAQPVFAVTPHNIGLIENSSTSLSVEFDESTTGISVVNLGPDQWSVTFPETFFVRHTPPFGWIEPENALNVNELSISPGIVNTMSVFSDVGVGTVLATVPDDTFIFVGTDAANNPIFAGLHDVGDAAAIPDAGSTFGLLVLSLFALLGISRLQLLKLL